MRTLYPLMRTSGTLTRTLLASWTDRFEMKAAYISVLVAGTLILDFDDER